MDKASKYFFFFNLKFAWKLTFKSGTVEFLLIFPHSMSASPLLGNSSFQNTQHICSSSLFHSPYKRVSELQLCSHRDKLAAKTGSLRPRTECWALKLFEGTVFLSGCYRLTIRFLSVSIQLDFIFRIYITRTWLKSKNLTQRHFSRVSLPSLSLLLYFCPSLYPWR